MDQNKPIRHRRSRQQIEELLNLFANSKVTVKDFCKQQGISRANFHKWKSRYKSKPDGKEKTTGFARVDVVDLSSISQRLFAEVNGIKIYQAVSASFLKELLA